MNTVYPWRDAPEAEFAVIGDPVSHSLSPTMHREAYAALGMPYRYEAIHVPQGEVAAALDHLRARGYQGVNVTVPHKEDALEWCQIREPLAERARAANTVRLADQACINTDAPGFLDTLADLALPNRRVLMLGAGGSARALLIALSESGYEVGVWNRTRERAEAMVQDLGVSATVLDSPDYEGAGLLVNTTAASLHGEQISVGWRLLAPGAVAYELMYAPKPTSFMVAAANHGYLAVDGRPLLAAQGARSFEYWLEVPAPRDVMLKALG